MFTYYYIVLFKIVMDPHLIDPTSWVGCCSFENDSKFSEPRVRELLCTCARCILMNLRSKTRQRATLLLHTWIYPCRSHFHITYFPFLRSNIPSLPAYDVFISQPIRYALSCSSYGYLIPRATLLSNKILEQKYVKERLKSSFKKFYGRYGDFIKWYDATLSPILSDII